MLLIVTMLLTCAFTATIVNAQQSYSKMVTFGDSFSDTGNLAATTVSFPFPYYQNRISDELVAADYLGSAVGGNAEASLHLDNRQGGYNFAVAGGNILGGDAEDLSSQVSAYLDRAGGNADPQALFVVFMGGNDLRSIRGTTNVSAADAQIDTVVSQLLVQLNRLKLAGAGTFFVPNMPDIGLLPETLQKEAGDPGITARASAYTLSYNQALSIALQSFGQQSGVILIQFDLSSFVADVIDQAVTFGFWHTTEGCFDPSNFSFHSDCLFGVRFDRFVFFDNLHPTGAMHQLMGDAMGVVVTSFIPPAPPVDPPNQSQNVNMGGILLLLLGEDEP